MQEWDSNMLFSSLERESKIPWIKNSQYQMKKKTVYSKI